jgi:hypothetical protein
MPRVLAIAALAFAFATGCSQSTDANAFAVAGDETDGDIQEDDLTRREMIPLLHEAGTFFDVEIRSDVPLDSATAERAAGLAHDAYLFDQKLLDVGGTPSVRPPFLLGLPSAALLGGHNGACTNDANTIVAALSDFQPSLSGFAIYAMGHELVHMTMWRLGAIVTKIPIYAHEGIATSVGWWFFHRTHPRWPFIQQRLVALTRARAEKTVTTFRVTADYKNRPVSEVSMDESVGGFFIEYLRAHLRQDTHHAFGRISQRVGHGETFEEAVAAELGRPLAELEREFVDFVGATEGNSSERLAGTVWAD